MNVTIKKGKACGTVSAPPSKSMAHRLIICAALCEGESKIRGISSCDDVEATISCMTALGADMERDGDDLTVRGIDVTKATPNDQLFCSESGSTLRFLIPIALLSGKTVMFRGKEGLMRRPMDIYRDLCDENGMAYLSDGNSITVRGPLRGGSFTVPGNVSSQFISGLLFALPLQKEDSRIKITPPIESRPYLDMTLYAIKLFGVKAEWEDEHTLFIPGGQKYSCRDLRVEGDYSGAAFTDGLNCLGGEVKVEGLNDDTIQGDRVYKKYFKLIKSGAPNLHIGDCPDLGPVLIALCAANHGGVFTGTRRLKIKESDRAKAMADELQKFGVSVHVYNDTVTVYPVKFHEPIDVLSGHNDHRIVMALSILLTLTGGTISGAEAVGKSYPNFFNDLESLGIEVVKK